jgi:protein phosphatase
MRSISAMENDREPSEWELGVEHAVLTDVGMRRADNQDALAVMIASSRQIWQQRGHLFMVADGMGAHAAGELASKLATDMVPHTYCKRLDLSPQAAIATATEDANRQIHNRGQASPDFRGMGTTCTTLLLLPDGAIVAHVGDSRAYRLRGDRFEQLTFDHSLLWEMRAAGQVNDETPPDFIPRNIITRSLGPAATVQVDVEGPFPIALGDTFLLCSDGLCGPVKDEEIGTVLMALPPPEAVRALVNLANLRGGPDNITVIVAQVTGKQISHGDRTASGTSANPAEGPPVRSLAWILAGVLGLAAFGLAALECWACAAAFLAVAVLSAVAGMLPFPGQTPPAPNTEPLPRGKGPYGNWTCPADGRFAEGLADLVQQLRDAATTGEWTVDWDSCNTLMDQADVARKAGDQLGTVRDYLRAISLMMGQLRSHGDTDLGDDVLPV